MSMSEYELAHLSPLPASPASKVDIGSTIVYDMYVIMNYRHGDCWTGSGNSQHSTLITE